MASLGLSGKESACNAGDLGLIPGSGRSPEETAPHSSILAWEIPWTEEPGGLQSMWSPAQPFLLGGSSVGDAGGLLALLLFSLK